MSLYKSLFRATYFLPFIFFASFPTTTNYSLQSYSFGSGSVVNSSTTTYAIEGNTGSNSGQSTSTINTTIKPGFIQTQQANVPVISTLDNGGGLYYNKLHFVVDNQANPTDALYLISVSTDNFVSNIAYLQTDGTLSSTLLLSDYQSYGVLGGASGSLIVGLNPSTTYYVRALATAGKFTESNFGPISSVATVAPILNFSLDTSTQPAAPFSVNLGSLNAGQIVTSSQTINTSISTNGASGGNVYISSQYGGLHSPSTNYTINSTSNDLATVPEDYGAQVANITVGSGGPLNSVNPYNTTGTQVGAVSQSMHSLYSSLNPINNGNGQLVLKAKTASTDTAATDYQDVLTFVASGNY